VVSAAAVRIDTADPGSIQAAAKDVLARFPELNVLVTMAGVMRVVDWHRPESFLRYGEARGDYDQVVAALNASDPHGE